MKKLITNYTFIPAEKKVILNDYTSVNVDGVLLITNVTSNTIIYNFASASLGGNTSGNTILLTYNTTSMSKSDGLQIFYDDAQDDNDGDKRSYEMLKEILNELKDIKLLLELK
jgi:hypothetical protein